MILPPGLLVDTESGAGNLWSMAIHFLTTGGGFWVLIQSVPVIDACPMTGTGLSTEATKLGGKMFRVAQNRFAAWFPDHETACTFAVAIQEQSANPTTAHATIFDDVMDFGVADEPSNSFYVQDFTFKTSNPQQILGPMP